MLRRSIYTITRNFSASFSPNNDFFCYQCEQTTGPCATKSMCGKNYDVAVLQDLLVENLKLMSSYADSKISEGEDFKELQDFTVDALYTTLTNVNFDEVRFDEYLSKILEFDLPSEAMALPEDWSLENLINLGEEFSIPSRIEQFGEDLVSLQEICCYGLKGYCAYLHEAALLTDISQEYYDYFTYALGELANDSPTMEGLVGLAMGIGENNIGVMEALDRGNNEQFGMPSPVEVSTTPVKGKAILVSGHNILTLKALLEQTVGKGINVYTHGELLPAHAYPEINKFEHLVGHYGSAWQNQKKEFKDFPGSILMTTNCILQPHKKYKDRIFSHSIVGHPDAQHVVGMDFTDVIESSLSQKGFKKDGKASPAVMTGFMHGFVGSIGEVVVNAVKEGDIEHFWLVGGCDGVKESRNYYTDLVEQLPDNHVILTLACGKFKFNHLQEELGVIETQGAQIPRLLDVGQCNDAYSAVVIASLLASAFELEDLNDLPLSIVLSWFEQKAVVILLSLLHLNLQNMRLGPTVPAFISPAVLDFLVENFKIAPITTAEEDIKTILEEKGK